MGRKWLEGHQFEYTMWSYRPSGRHFVAHTDNGCVTSDVLITEDRHTVYVNDNGTCDGADNKKRTLARKKGRPSRAKTTPLPRLYFHIGLGLPCSLLSNMTIQIKASVLSYPLELCISRTSPFATTSSSAAAKGLKLWGGLLGDTLIGNDKQNYPRTTFGSSCGC